MLALNRGLQNTIYRKGGIQEPDGHFRPAFSAFYLYPAREHQQAHLLLPQHQHLVEEAERTQQGQVVTITSWAEVTQITPLTEPQDIPGTQIYAPQFFQARLDYKPHIPLLAMQLTVHQLPEPIIFTETTEQAGCKSWVDILAPAPPPFPIPAP